MKKKMEFNIQCPHCHAWQCTEQEKPCTVLIACRECKEEFTALCENPSNYMNEDTIAADSKNIAIKAVSYDTFPEAPAPWVSIDPGEAFESEQNYFSLQTMPITWIELVAQASKKNIPKEKIPIRHLYSILIFAKNNPSSLPHTIISVEQVKISETWQEPILKSYGGEIAFHLSPLDPSTLQKNAKMELLNALSKEDKKSLKKIGTIHDLKRIRDRKGDDFRFPVWILLLLWHLIVFFALSSMNRQQNDEILVCISTLGIPWIIWTTIGIKQLKFKEKGQTTKLYRIFRVSSLLLPAICFFLALPIENGAISFLGPLLLYFIVWIIYFFIKKIILPALSYVNSNSVAK